MVGQNKTKHKRKKKEGAEKKHNGRRCRGDEEEEEEAGCSGSQIRVYIYLIFFLHYLRNSSIFFRTQGFHLDTLSNKWHCH